MSSTNIFLHHNFDHTKDFVGSSIKGTIGASLAYLEMQRLGYAWTGHWEDCTSPSAIAKSPTSKKSKGSCAPKSNVPTPDFVFASSRDVCLVDAKGSSRSMKDVRSIAKNEWKRQIYSNRLAKLRAGGTATEGRIIATSLAHPHGIGLVTAYGRFPSAASSPGTLITTLPSATINAIKSVQQINFINAFYFLGLNAIAAHFVGGPVGQARAQLSWARHSAIDIDNRGAVFPGVRRVIDLGSQGAWSMQPFCRLDVLEEAFENLLSDNAPPVSEAHLILTPQIGESASSVDDKMNATDRMIVQSRDGVGAIFERVKNT
ncbi:hypothetical protein [Stutzerimonas kunmingensis]|jgi:hypothetical protein|nr:hypothetical protein [Stutzerimonas kunmingensis]